MAPLPRRTGPNRLMDRIDAGLDPSGTTKRSPAMANAPALTGRGPMPLSNAASQKAYAPIPSGVDNRLKPAGASPWTTGGAMNDTINASRERNYGFRRQQMDAFGTDMSKPRTFLPSTNQTMDQISREGEAYRRQLEGPVMPPNLTPQGQEAWAANQRMQRQAENQRAVDNTITGGGTRLIGPNGMATPGGGGGYLPSTAGGSGRPLVSSGAIRPDGTPWVSVAPEEETQYSLSPAQQSLRDEMQRRYDKAQMDRDQSLAATFSPGFQRSQAQLDRMRQQRADSSNPKWEEARQNRIAAHKSKRGLITARAAQDAANRDARLNARKGYLAETAFQNMSPEQQLSYMTGGRSNAGSNPAQDEYYRAQADTLRTQAKNAERMGGAMAGGATPGAPSGTEAPAASPYSGSPKAKLGIPEGESNMAKGLVRAGADTRNPETRRMLTEWAKSDPEDEYKGLLHMRIFGNPNPDVLMNNQLRIEIRRGNWSAVDLLLKNASTQTKPSEPPAAAGPDLGGLGSGGGLGSMGGVM